MKERTINYQLIIINKTKIKNCDEINFSISIYQSIFKLYKQGMTQNFQIIYFAVVRSSIVSQYPMLVQYSVATANYYL